MSRPEFGFSGAGDGQTPAARVLGFTVRLRVALILAVACAAALTIGLQLRAITTESIELHTAVERVARVRYFTATVLQRLEAHGARQTAESRALLTVSLREWRALYGDISRDFDRFCGTQDDGCASLPEVRSTALPFARAVHAALGSTADAAGERVHLRQLAETGARFLTRYDALARSFPDTIARHELEHGRRLFVMLAATCLLALLAIAGISEAIIRRLQGERSALDRALHQQERIAAVAAQSERAVLIVDRAGHIEWVNGAFTQLFEYGAGEVSGRVCTMLMNPAAAPRDGEVSGWLEAMARDPDTLHEGPVRVKSGREIWLGARVRHFLDADGSQVGFVIAAVDITEKKRLRDALQAQHQVLESVLETLPALVFWKDVNGVYLGCNKAFATRLGLASPAEIVGRKTSEFDILPESHRAAVEAADRRILATGEPELNVPFTLTDGTARLSILSSKVPLRDADGRVCGIVGALADITELVEAHEHAAHLRQRYDLAFRGSGDGVWDWNHADRSLYLSPRLKEMLGFEDAEIENSVGAWALLVHPDDQAASRLALRRCLRGLTAEIHFEQRLRHRDGKYRWVLVRGRRVDDGLAGILPSRIVGTVSDITEFRLQQAQHANARKLEAIGQLAAGVAHEINTPCQFVGDNLRFLADGMRDIVSCIDSLRSAAPDRELQPAEIDALLAAADFDFLETECPKAIEQSIEGVERISRIVRALKELSHPGQDKVPTDINRAITSAVTVATNEWKYFASLETDLDSELPLVLATPSEIHQVILNLVVNAAHAVESKSAGGTGAKGLIRITTRRDGESAEIRVSDDGCGIPEEIRARIFDPFFTTKAVGKGTGQGLTIVHKVVAEHHGSLRLESEVGRGTTFVIRLPIDEQRAQRAAA